MGSCRLKKESALPAADAQALGRPGGVCGHASTAAGEEGRRVVDREGNCRITAETALRLARYFDTTPHRKRVGRGKRGEKIREEAKEVEKEETRKKRKETKEVER